MSFDRVQDDICLRCKWKSLVAIIDFCYLILLPNFNWKSTRHFHRKKVLPRFNSSVFTLRIKKDILAKMHVRSCLTFKQMEKMRNGSAEFFLHWCQIMIIFYEGVIYAPLCEIEKLSSFCSYAENIIVEASMIVIIKPHFCLFDVITGKRFEFWFSEHGNVKHEW